MGIYYESGSETLCFRHAVERAGKGSHVSTETYSTRGDWYPSCVDCKKEDDKEYNDSEDDEGFE